MRTGKALELNRAAEGIEDILRPFTKPQREVIAHIAGRMLDADDESKEEESRGALAQAQGA